MKKIISIISIAVIIIVAMTGQAETATGSERTKKITISGDSMYPTINDGEQLLYELITNNDRSMISRGTCVICTFPGRTQKSIFGFNTAMRFVERVVGVPGDIIYRENAVTHVLYEVDGVQVDEMLDENKATWFPDGSPDDYPAYVLGDDEYFVAGDNRYNSHDSRDWNDSNPSGDIGPINGDMIFGVVKRVISPVQDAREIK